MRTIKKHLLELRHAMPGRARFKVHPIRFNTHEADDLSMQLLDMPGVDAVRTNIKCAGVVILFDAAQTDVQKLSDKLQAIYSAPADIPNPPMPFAELCRSACAACTQKDIRHNASRFGLLSVVLGGVLVRQFFFRIAVGSSFFSPLGLFTLAAAYPLLKESAKDIKDRRITLETFLGGSIAAAVVAGEAITALEVLWITSGSNLLNAVITERSRRAVGEILEISAKNAYILQDGVEVEVAVEDIMVGDIVVLHGGEKISVDGKLVDGEAMVDEAPINGRAEHILRSPGDMVHAGTFVVHGVIYVEATRVGDRTYLSRTMHQVECVLENRASIEGVADRLAKRLINIGGVAVLGTLVFTQSFMRAFSVLLVVACPCATALAASSAVSAAMSAAARRRILIKGGRYLEEVGNADVFCFDKTGTITSNEPFVREVVNFSRLSDAYLLKLAYSAEKHSSHPMAAAFKQAAREQEVQAIPHTVCETYVGRGMRAVFEGKEVLVGNHKLMRQFKVKTDKAAEQVERLVHDGDTVVYLAREGKMLAVYGIGNALHPGVLETMAFLRSDGVDHIMMVTGDEEHTAKALAEHLGMDDVHFSVMPDVKASVVEDLKTEGRKVVMVGDGINDALALAEADIGIAMGTGGSEVAVEAADIAVVEDDLHGIIYVRALSGKTLSIINQNFWLATGSNAAGIVLGALGFLPPVFAGFLHILHTVGVVANSSRLLGFEDPTVKKRPKRLLPFHIDVSENEKNIKSHLEAKQAEHAESEVN
jgi:cation-transporting P-type ATPase C